MDDLIEALTIFKKYVTEDSFHSEFPTHCEHDIMYVYVDSPMSEFDRADVVRLKELGFSPDIEFAEEGAWSSHKFGSC